MGVGGAHGSQDPVSELKSALVLLHHKMNNVPHDVRPRISLFFSLTVHLWLSN